MSAIQMNSPSPVNSCSRSLNVAATTMFPLFKISYKCRELSTFLAKDLLKVSSTFTKYMNPPRGGTQQMFIRGGSAPRSNPLPFHIPFFTKKVPLSYTFYWQMVPLLHTLLRLLYPFSDNSHLLTLLQTFYRPEWQISLPFYILQLVKSVLCHIPEAWKRYQIESLKKNLLTLRFSWWFFRAIWWPRPRCLENP